MTTNSTDAQAKTELKTFYKEILADTLKEAAQPTLNRIAVSDRETESKLKESTDALSRATSGLRSKLDKLEKAIGEPEDDDEPLANSVAQALRCVRKVEGQLSGFDPRALAANLTRATAEAMNAPGSPLSEAFAASQQETARVVDEKLSELSVEVTAGKAQITDLAASVEDLRTSISRLESRLFGTNSAAGELTKLARETKQRAESEHEKVLKALRLLESRLFGTPDETEGVFAKLSQTQVSVLQKVESSRKAVLDAIGPVDLAISSSEALPPSLPKLLAQGREQMMPVLYVTVVLTVINLVAIIFLR